MSDGKRNIEKLHTLARRYCLDKIDFWWDEYSKLTEKRQERQADSYHYTDEALSLFPRYQVYSAVLVEIESLTPQDFSSLDEAREIICLAGQTADSVFTKDPQEPLQKKAIQEERDNFCRYTAEFAEDELAQVPDLFYRRYRSDVEGDERWAKVRRTWGIEEGYWYPLTVECRNDLVVFQNKYFDEEMGAETLREILARRGIHRIWEFREGRGEDFEMDLSIFEAYYNGREGYWSSEGLDWIIYASHESSVTIGGEWLIEEIKKAWANWEQRIWNSPFYD